MKPANVYAVYFSPTKGTKTYVTRIAKGISDNVTEIDLTVLENRKKQYEFSSEDLVIVGAPVYVGRLPLVEGGIFQCLKGNHTPVVLNVSYGNREFDDALLEEKNILEERGFTAIGAGAWIAPHTFSEKIAWNRPNGTDYAKADEFAESLKETLMKESWKEKALEIPGQVPYRPYKRIPFFPSADETCSKCKKCVEVCPVGAISEEDLYHTDPQKCIACLACVKNCPVHCRQVRVPEFAPSKAQLEEKLTATDKQPTVYNLK